MPQTIGTRTVRILRANDGTRFAEVTRRSGLTYHVPAELLPLAAGKDAWMRDIRLRCSGCGQPHKAADLGSGLYCPACVEEAEQENAAIDRRIDP
jgi:hypothetical protein